MNQLLSTTLLDHFDNDCAPRHGLPGAAYVSETFKQLEDEHLFAKSWTFVGFAHQLPLSGDIQPLTTAGQNIFLIRNEKHEIKAFHNVCRHRNLQLVVEPSNCGRVIRCPYHSWSYDLAGKLKNTPFFGGAAKQPCDGFDLKDNGLAAIDCEVWHDWIFVNLDSNAVPFADFVKPLKTMLGDNDVTQYKPVAIVEFGEVACNWKLLMENFIEPYHVQFVHKKTTSQPLENHYAVVEGHCLGSAADLSDEQVANARVGTLGVTSRYLTLFPNFVIGTYRPDQLGIHLNIPINAGTTRQSRVIYLHKDSKYSEDQIQGLKKLWHSVHLEDHEMTQRLQIGRQSHLAAAGGVLSPYWEIGVRKFQELVANAIRPGLSNNAPT
jgi:choline monooxygenase